MMMQAWDVLAVITRFQRVFDQKSWDDFDLLLTEKLYIDYSQFRDEAAGHMLRSEYKQLRVKALSHLKLQHNLSNPLIEVKHEQAMVSCNYQIYRFSEHDHFHSFGRYEFELLKQAGQWRICAIRQILIQNIGNPQIHYAQLRSSHR